jgi:hypothetical protein
MEKWKTADPRERLHDLSTVRIKHLRSICANLSNHLRITPIARRKRISDELLSDNN